MKYQNIASAVEEAERFIAKSKILLGLTGEESEYVLQGRESASVRRCSLELSNLLSQMRKSDWDEA
jgi:hypothetical protein